MPPAKLGLVYSHTGVQKFIEVIGAARTRELFLVGRPVDAARAEVWGLVNEVVPAAELEARSLELAEEIAANAPLSLSGNKRVIRELTAAHAVLDPAIGARATSSSAARASPPRTSARASGRSARSAHRAGRAVSPTA